MQGTPRQPDPTRRSLLPPVRVQFEYPQDDMVPIETRKSNHQGVPKRLFIKEGDLRKYGFTEGVSGMYSTQDRDEGTQESFRAVPAEDHRGDDG